jgi:glycosyltransferase involved in cell wall biosynthesis
LPERRLKIVQLISSSATSGAERHVLHLSRQLQSFGHQVEVICPPGQWLSDALTDNGVRVRTNEMRGRGWYETFGLLMQSAAGRRADIIHTHLTRAAYIGYSAGLLSRTPVVTSVHIANNDQIYRRLARRRNRLVAVSSFVGGMLRGRGIPSKYIDTVYNGTDFADVKFHDPNEARREFGIAPSAKVIGLVGRVCVEKGHLDLITALPAIRAAHPNAHVVFVGKVEERFASDLNEAIDAVGMKKHITLAGIRHDVPRILDSFTLSTMPSHIETFGVAAIEAMARGKAVVASNVGGLPEVVKHRSTGLLVDLRPEAIADAVNYLLANDQVREDMGRCGRRVVEERFTLNEMSHRMEEVYGRALGTRFDYSVADEEAELLSV